MKSKLQFLVILFTVFAVSAWAQTKHEFSVHAGGGLSTLSYTPTAGAHKLGLGVNFGAGYTFFFNPQWGISTGLSVALFNSKFESSSFSESYKATDGYNAGEFEYRYTANGYKETQRAFLLNIPVMAHFEINKWYVALGGKIGIPLNSSYENKLNELEVTPYYADGNFSPDDPNSMGFGTFPNALSPEQLGRSGDIALKPSFLLAAEAGRKWPLPNKMSLYTGVYLDYGLTKALKTDASLNRHLIEYDYKYSETEIASYQPNSILTAKTTRKESDGSFTDKPFVDKVKPLSAGIRLTWVFGRIDGKAQDGSAYSDQSERPKKGKQRRIKKIKVDEPRVADLDHQARTDSLLAAMWRLDEEYLKQC